MARYNQLSKYRTTWIENNGCIVVCYVKTNIVVTDSEGNVTLNSDGWQTVTTKRKMNQAAWQFALGYGVHQREGSWFVDVWSPALNRWLGINMPYHDGMTFNPQALRLAHNAKLAMA